MKKLIKRFSVSLIVLLLYTCSNESDDIITVNSSPNEFNSEVVVEWFKLIKVLTTETTGYTPPVAARAFGYTGVGLYESMQLGMDNTSSLSGKLNELNITSDYDNDLNYHWPTVANTTLAELTRFFYSNAEDFNSNLISNLENRFITQFRNNEDPESIERSKLLAVDIAKQIIEWSKSDGGHEAQFNNFPSGYSSIEGEQYWQPTIDNNYTPALQPYWGENRPFIDLNVVNAIPEDPPPYSTDPNSVFHQRALEVYNVVNTITPEQKVIAEFWSDDPETTATPPGHSISILNQLIDENNYDLGQSSDAFAKLAVGINDAFISCWKVKYDTNYPRPIAYINQYIDADWSPILITPPFPEYTSGHSVQSGVLAEVLTSIFGEAYSFVDNTHLERLDIDGTPRSYDNFYDMAEEAAISRLYGGIHFMEAIDNGLDQGYQIGMNVIDVFEN